MINSPQNLNTQRTNRVPDQIERGRPMGGTSDSLLDPAQINLSGGEYNPQQAAGTGATFSPGRTLLGQNYASPKVDPLAALLGEVPETVSSVAQTAKTIKRWDLENQEKLFNQTMVRDQELINNLAAKYKDSDVPLEELRKLNKERVSLWNSISTDIKDERVRSKYLERYNNTIRDFTQTNRNLRAASIAEVEREVNTTRITARRDWGSFSNYSTAVEELEARLEQELAVTEDPEYKNQLSEKLNALRIERVVVANEGLRREWTRQLQHSMPPVAERAEFAQRWFQGLSDSGAFESAGLNEEDVRELNHMFHDFIINSADSTRISAQQRLVQDHSNVVREALRPQGNKPAAFTQFISNYNVVDALGNPSLYGQLDVDGKERTIGQIVEDWATANNIPISVQDYIDQGFTKEQADEALDSVLRPLYTRASSALEAIDGMRRNREAARLETTFESIRLEARQMDTRQLDTTNFDRYMSLAFRANSLMDTPREDNAVIEDVKTMVLEDVTRSPHIMDAVSTGQLTQEDLFKKIGKALGFVIDGNEAVAVRGNSWAQHWLMAHAGSIGDGQEATVRMTQLVNAELGLIVRNIFQENRRQEEAKLELQERILSGDVPSGISLEDFSRAYAGIIDTMGITEQVFGVSDSEEILARMQENTATHGIPLDFTDPQFNRFVAATGGVTRAGVIQRFHTPVERDAEGTAYIPSVMASNTIVPGTESTMGYPRAIFEPMRNTTIAAIEVIRSAGPDDLNKPEVVEAMAVLRNVGDIVSKSWGNANYQTINRTFRAVANDKDSNMFFQFVRPFLGNQIENAASVLKDPATLRNFVGFIQEEGSTPGPTPEFNRELESFGATLLSMRSENSSFKPRMPAQRTLIEEDPEANGYNVFTHVVAIGMMVRQGDDFSDEEVASAYKVLNGLIPSFNELVLKAAVEGVRPDGLVDFAIEEVFTKVDFAYTYGSTDQSERLTIVSPTPEFSGNGSIRDADLNPNSNYHQFGEQPSLFGFADRQRFITKYNLQDLPVNQQLGVMLDNIPIRDFQSLDALESGLTTWVSAAVGHLVEALPYRGQTSEGMQQKTELQKRLLEIGFGIVETHLTQAQSGFERGMVSISDIRNRLIEEMYPLVNRFTAYGPDGDSQTGTPTITQKPLFELRNKGSGYVVVPESNLVKTMRRLGMFPVGVSFGGEAYPRFSVENPHWGAFFFTPNVPANLETGIERFWMMNNRIQEDYGR